ncbi:MAG: hypothetical protein Q8K45_16855 [Rubrivivax sp.]|nr:hypothetical protein [Rubrivivax sp.]
MKPDFSPGCRTFAAAALTLGGLVVASASAAEGAGLQRCRALAEADARLACYDALPLGPSFPLRPAAPAPAASPPAVPPAQDFGRTPHDTPAAVSSHIPGRFEGWGPRTRFTLANGQVWQVVDGSSGAYWLQDPKVEVRRAALGGFVIDIAGVNRVPRVQRVD